MRYGALIIFVLGLGGMVGEGNGGNGGSGGSGVCKGVDKELEALAAALKEIPSPTYGAALMLKVADEDAFEAKNNIYFGVKNLHVTIGFLEMKDEEALKKALMLGKGFLEQELKKGVYNFCIEKCEPKFGKVTVFTPTKKTENLLKKLNLSLEQNLAQSGIKLNPQTQSSAYIPHMTIVFKVLDPNAVSDINQKLQNKICCLAFDSVESSKIKKM
ncbi:TPA: hypothetical protein DDZ86_00875 [Candidatus Dependentiae bacterium]|nr:MAG: hypothetical protein UW09_C0004G0057 [candidate division TM6 bacterium GW2011_GWF2_43_87]HBL98178.1 hypothetical protein [Candidatus Dependentiae bacterium]